MGRIPLKRANSTSDPSNKKAKRTNYVEHQEKDTVPTKKTDASMTEPAKILREMLNAYEEQIQRDGACLNQFQETLDSCVDQEAETFLWTGINYVEEKRNAASKIVSEINGALQRIAEIDEHREIDHRKDDDSSLPDTQLHE
ncbi:uncharacterized protein LOC142817251 isoform X1 [Rhipicephalus microplus]|uniref:uncharacterized protein LOC142817251 isoform X1 n=1 Tax=Rhipicephalus microplus TaxID=6941 RepID=UPI003F6C6709